MSHLIRISGTDLSFCCQDEQSILDAGLKAGIQMPYSCRQGVCGNCAGVVLSGEVACPPASDATPPGKYLFCQCQPLSDLEIAPESWHRIDPSARQVYSVKVYRNTVVADDVSVLQLRLPAGQRVRFKAGQYLQVGLPDGTRRSYSMANPPFESDTLQLHIRHVAGGKFSQMLPQLKPGELLQVELPYGNFGRNEDTEAPMLCIAGGTGFAPVKSLLDEMIKKRIERRVTLIWGARNLASLYLMTAVERWKKMMPGFTFIAAVEDAADAEAIGGFHGRVDEAVRNSFATLNEHEVYCCGSPQMVTAAKKVCVERGLATNRFFSDVFVQGPAAVT